MIASDDVSNITSGFSPGFLLDMSFQLHVKQSALTIALSPKLVIISNLKLCLVAHWPPFQNHFSQQSPIVERFRNLFNAIDFALAIHLYPWESPRSTVAKEERGYL